MKIKIVYHSMTGNTQKIAEALTENYRLSEAIDLLFIGDGIYAGEINKKTKAFIQTLDASLVENAAVFGTLGGQNQVIDELAECLRERGINVCGETFACKGQTWFIANRKHPDQNDIDNAVQFGKNIIEFVENN